MKKFVSLVLAVCLSSSLFAVNIFNYIPYAGSFSSSTQTDFVISSKFGNYFRTPSLKTVRKFNEDKKEIESIEYTPRDVVIDKITTAYDSYGNITEQKGFSSDSELLWKTVITYKAGKKLDSSEYDKNDNLKTKTIYNYDNNNLVDETGYNSEGYLMWKIVYKYDNKGKYTSISQYFSDGSLDEESIFTYTDDGKIDTITTINGINYSSTQEVFRYTNGQLTEVTTYNNEKQITKRLLIKYDTTGNVVKLSDYEVNKKFGTTLNELVSQTEFVYQY